MGCCRRREVTQAMSGVFIGDFLSSCIAPPGDHSQWYGIIDLTNDLPQIGKSIEYLCIPTWHGVPPTIEEIGKACAFASKCEKKGPLLVHCTYGSGRAACLACAILVDSAARQGVDLDWEAALHRLEQRQRGF